jgi:hypothetical protein
VRNEVQKSRLLREKSKKNLSKHATNLLLLFLRTHDHLHASNRCNALLSDPNEC